MIIPTRFISAIDAHLLGNILDIEHYPLILAVVGRPGMGKTYQLRNYLNAVGVDIISISSADLESDRAGEPAKLIQQKYIEASAKINNNVPSVLLIDDIDTTLGEWENHTGTVNHQNILAFLMHIADNPKYIENVGKVNRVPIIFTGNDFDRMYKPLIREGRANRFDWEPTREEKVIIVKSIFGFEDYKKAEILVDAYPAEKISFFANLLVSNRNEKLSVLARSVIFKRLLESETYRENIYSQYCKITENIEWNELVPESRKNIILTDE